MMNKKEAQRKTNQLYAKFLKKAEKEGYDHNAINQIVGLGPQAVLTEAEIKAGQEFEKWLLEDIGKRYELIGGNTWQFTVKGGNVLIPAGLAASRIGLNSHMWHEKGYKLRA